MESTHKILSDITVWTKYAKFLPEKNRRETWEELVTRNMEMHIRKFPKLEGAIRDTYRFVFERKVLPSMRSLQFGGLPIEVNPVRQYNCSYLAIDDYRAFNETMFLLLSGTGVGYSIQKHHIEKLPTIQRAIRTKKYLVSDNIEGWADAVKVLVKSYLGLSSWRPLFDFRSIRAKGERLITSGGVAPGPEPLRICLAHIEAIFERKKDGEKLTSLECHDILCHIADAVLSGGIRRSAMIALFDKDDEEMLTCKFGLWYETNPQRGRANNSVVLLRDGVEKSEFLDLWKKVELSNSGEPGFFFTNDLELGTNPCFTGDMRLLTESGYKSFRELSLEGPVSLINAKGEVVEGSVWSNGVKKTVVLKLSNGKEIKCTPDHRFMLPDGSECLAKDTQSKRLTPLYLPNQTIDEYVKYGFIQGDGATGRLDSETHRSMEIYFGQNDLDVAEIFGYSETGRKYVNGYNEILSLLGMDSNPLPTRKFPKYFSDFSIEQRKSFLKGMYSANGSVITTSRIAYKTTSKELAKQLVSILIGLGLNPYVTTNKEKLVEFSNGNYTCKESYDINIGRYNEIAWFFENIGFVQNYKMVALKELLVARAPIVQSIKDGDEVEVFDFNLQDDTHWGVVEGVVAHNCGEISLNSMQFCNLVEVNASDVVDQKDLEERIKAAAFIGTIQASYTDFHYLRPEWKRTTEREALLGIGMTGIASGKVLNLDLQAAAKVAKKLNEDLAEVLGIMPAARITTVKPSGTSSMVLGTSSGVHAWHDEYYVRRMRIGKNEAIYTYLSIYHPELLEDDLLYPSIQSVVSVPIKAPVGAITRSSETAISFLERVKFLHETWISPGHVYGKNTHNVSATVTLKPTEWEEVGEWLWNNRDSYTGLSFLPESLGSYKQTPFETIDKETYEELLKHVTELDVTKIVEINDNTNLNDQQACAGGACLV